MQTYFCWILFHKPNFALTEAASLLKEHGLNGEQQNEELLVSWHNGPTLRVSFASGTDVQQESQEISTKEELSQCDKRFQISFDDLDEVLDEINTLIEVQITLQNATRGFLWNSWNGQLSAPEEEGET